MPRLRTNWSEPTAVQVSVAAYKNTARDLRPPGTGDRPYLTGHRSLLSPFHTGYRIFRAIAKSATAHPRAHGAAGSRSRLSAAKGLLDAGNRDDAA